MRQHDRLDEHEHGDLSDANCPSRSIEGAMVAAPVPLPLYRNLVYARIPAPIRTAMIIAAYLRFDIICCMLL
jgi:hypothetical protein